MKTILRKTEMKRISRFLSGVLIAGLALHCGGGGIGGTGSVSGFGSVWVNGIEWFTDTAVITFDGVPGTEADLRIGMVVDLDGDPTGEATATASSVSFDDAIQGPVSSISPVSATVKELTIFGQTVVVQQGVAVFDDSDPSFAFGTVALDDVLEVSGHVDGAGVINATWVRRLGVVELGQTAVELEGVIQSLTGFPSFVLGGTLVLVDGDTDLSELAGGLMNGRSVEVEGILVAIGIVQADRVTDTDAPPVEIANFSLEGIVSDFVSLADFRVAGQRVDASSATFTPLDPSFVADGVVVEVEGPISSGLLVADEVELESGEVTIHAQLASTSDVDPVAGRVVLLGIEVVVAPDAQLTDDRDGLPGFGLTDLVGGDFLQINALQQSSGEVVAGELDRTAATDVFLRGPLTGFDEAVPDVEVSGVNVPLSGAADFYDLLGAPLSLAEFFQELRLGRELGVMDWMDADDTAIDVADEAELER
jgi:hypothetical protein